MFTGLVAQLGAVADIRSKPPGKRLVIRAREFAADAAIGESIAVSGCCLTVVEVSDDSLSFDAGPETLSRTTLGNLAPGDSVNMERSLRVGDPLGGHFVTGHVDGIGTLEERADEKDWATLWFRTPAALTRQMASKGSIAVDGVSLTLVDVKAEKFSVALIPHTLSITTLGRLKIGDRVNLETDLLAKYAQKGLAQE